MNVSTIHTPYTILLGKKASTIHDTVKLQIQIIQTKRKSEWTYYKERKAGFFTRGVTGFTQCKRLKYTEIHNGSVIILGISTHNFSHTART